MAGIAYVKAEELRAGMENWNGRVYCGDGEPFIRDGLVYVTFTPDDSEEYPEQRDVCYRVGERVEVWV